MTDREIAVAAANELVHVGPELSGMPRNNPNYWVYVGDFAVSAPLHMTEREAEQEAKALRKVVSAGILDAIQQAKRSV